MAQFKQVQRRPRLPISSMLRSNKSLRHRRPFRIGILGFMGLLTTPTLRTARLALMPLTVEIASEMVAVLADTRLYTFTGGEPPTLSHLKSRYQAQTAGSNDPNEIWHNWIIVVGETSRPVGFVQTTIEDDTADVAWVVGTPWQGKGIAREAASAMCAWLIEQGTTRITAHIHPEHIASEAVARSVGLHRTDNADEDGEVIWSSAATSPTDHSD
jgi:RimJ/RimL family protein N-acetyltransferase